MYFLTFILFLNHVEKYNSGALKIDLLSYLVILTLNYLLFQYTK